MLKELKALLPYIKKYRWKYLWGLLCLIVVDGAQLLMPSFIRRAIDTISTGDFLLAIVLGIAIALIAVQAAISAGRFLWRFYIHGSSRRIEKELRDKLFSHWMGLSSSYYQKNKTGDLMARATNDLGAVRQAVGMGVVSLFDGVFMTIAILVILFISYPSIAIWTILPLPIITIMIITFGGMIGKVFGKVQANYSKMSDIAQETITGIRVVRSFVRESWFTKEFSKANDEYKKSNMTLAKIFGFFFPLIGFLSGITTVILVRVGGVAVVEGSMSAGDFVAIYSYLNMLVWPMVGAGFTVNTLQRGAASMGRINEVLNEVPDIADPGAPIEGRPKGDIEIRGLDFSYPGNETKILHGVDMSLPMGSTLGILGRTGSGKSTLVKLLPRLIDPPEGAIRVGGRDIRDFRLHELRSIFGMVPQDSFLFSDTIRANIGFGLTELSGERLSRVADISTISRDLKEFSEGLDTIVGERGLTLSGGQKQRVALARALAVDPDILILDDALSSVDAETESHILSGLEKDRDGRSTIIIAHRVSAIKDCDQIIVIDKGTIIQRGSHEELANSDGLYRDIYRLQTLEQAKGGQA